MKIAANKKIRIETEENLHEFCQTTRKAYGSSDHDHDDSRIQSENKSTEITQKLNG